MSNKTNSSAANTLKATDTQVDTVLELTGDLTPEQIAQVKDEMEKSNDVVNEVLKGGKLKGLKASLRRRSWVDIVGAGAIAAVGVTADMVVTNKLNKQFHGEDALQYSLLEITGVAGVTGLVASTIRAGLDFIPAVNNNDTIGVVTTSFVGNAAYVTSSLVRNAALDLIKGKASIAVNVETLAEEA